MSNQIEQINVYFAGANPISFERGGRNDWYAWDVNCQRRIVTFRTRRELLEARARLAATEPTTRCGMVDAMTAYDVLRGQ